MFSIYEGENYVQRENKSIAFSYDDRATQDIHMIKIFNKYNVKATFNINSELLG